MIGRAYVVGLDLGQASDFTAAATVERVPAPLPTDPPTFHARDLRRWPLGTSYPRIVADVAELVDTPPLAGACLLVFDQTGIGRPIGDYLRAAAVKPAAIGWVPGPGERGPTPTVPDVPHPIRCPLVGVTLTAGGTVRRERGDWYVPKADVIAAAQVAAQTQRLKVAPALPEAETLTRELREYRYQVGAGGHVGFGVAAEWRTGANDDLLFAASLAVWAGEHILPRTSGIRSL